MFEKRIPNWVGVKQWQAIRAVVPTTQYFVTHTARHGNALFHAKRCFISPPFLCMCNVPFQFLFLPACASRSSRPALFLTTPTWKPSTITFSNTVNSSGPTRRPSTRRTTAVTRSVKWVRRVLSPRWRRRCCTWPPPSIRPLRRTAPGRPSVTTGSSTICDTPWPPASMGTWTFFTWWRSRCGVWTGRCGAWWCLAGSGGSPPRFPMSCSARPLRMWRGSRGWCGAARIVAGSWIRTVFSGITFKYCLISSNSFLIKFLVLNILRHFKSQGTKKTEFNPVSIYE